MMRIKVDLHVHTTRSKDAVTKLSEALTVAKAIGIDGIALTDHDVPPCLENEDLQGLLVIPGMEVRTTEAHILALGIEESLGKPQKAREAVEAIHGLGGIAILAHPYASILGIRGRRGIKDACFDAIEVFNSGTPFFRISTFLARRLAKSLDLPATGGSDSHLPETIGYSYTILECNSPTVSEALKAIKSGRTEAFGRPITLSQRFKKLWITGFHKHRCLPFPSLP
ncbi:CehA/McbA family metallohydrolase [Candidatus Bathyarchaeota archaeon]|nr:CehA/McbA family metallohydrolase [Candidatus Bathyarchaeota archaeon]MBS7627603.1 CehA/McbA family metallohydrolase [Candidatus Bathyarchaeota archaeon]